MILDIQTQKVIQVTFLGQVIALAWKRGCDAAKNWAPSQKKS